VAVHGTGKKPPIVLMAGGLGAQIDFGLEAYAEAFAESGLAVLLFDYRNFGSSEGTPRNWVRPCRAATFNSILLVSPF
jgi:fermentation-respiration switch protein FrsA (DUF1100 family)